MRYSKNLRYNILGACEHPQRIYNRYLDEMVTVPCGTCKTCQLNKSAKYSRLCSIEESYYKYCYFVTLTYSPEHLPVCRLVEVVHKDDLAMYRDKFGSFVFNDDCADDRYVTYRLVADSKDRPEYGNDMYSFPGIYPMNSFALEFPSHINKFFDKCNLGGYRCSYLCPSDLQKFLKRLRKNVSKYTDSKIRYYACGEYGPEHYRCHWHLLLYFDDRKISENIIEDVRKSWKYGRVDISASRGKTASYVAGYVTNPSTLPAPLASRELRPRNYHSFCFGFKAFEQDKEAIYEKGLEYFNEKVHCLIGKYSTIQCPDRLRHYLFPRCAGYARKTYEELLRSYTIFQDCKSFFPLSTRKEIVDTISYFLLGVYDLDLVDSVAFRDFIYFFRSHINVFETPAAPALDYEGYIYRLVYCIVHTSEHFLNFVCDGKNELIHTRLKQIIKFYEDMKYVQLRNWYQAQEEYGAFCDDFDLFYDSSLDKDDSELRKNSVYNYVLNQNYIRFGRSVKTKRQNDVNGYFTNPLFL